MRHLNKIASFCCATALALLALTGCEGGELYNVNAPDWISEKVDSINNANSNTDEEVLEGMQEDVYTIGNTDFTSGWWSSFSKYYVIPDGQKWNAVLNLNINPSDNTYYRNFALVVTNDVDRGGTGYTEYGAIRFDTTGDSISYNSQWGTLYFRYTTSTQLLSPDGSNLDAGVQSLGGRVILTVDRTSENGLTIKMRNSSVTKTYAQPYKEPNLNEDPTNTNIRCFLVPEGSYIDFQQSNIVPIGGLTSAEDKNPLSMELQNVPDQVNVGTSLEEAMANISAIVTFEEGVTKTVPASELYLSAIPSMSQVGEKNLVAIYNKTFKGENCDQPIVANATFEVVEKIVSIEVTSQPSYTQYYYYNSTATEGLTDRMLAFDPTGMVITATYANGTSKAIDNAILSFSTVPATAGSHDVTITADEGVTATVRVNVSQSTVSAVTNTSNMIGAADNSTAWWTEFSDDFNVPVGATRSISFTNYSSKAGSWNNFCVILRKADMTEYGVVRSDNYGWGNGYGACVHNGTQGDWATWLEGMDGAKITVYVTNCGNGTADIQAVMAGSTGTTSIQYYLGINTVDPSDLNFALTIDSSHIVFGAQ